MGDFTSDSDGKNWAGQIDYTAKAVVSLPAVAHSGSCLKFKEKFKGKIKKKKINITHLFAQKKGEG